MFDSPFGSTHRAVTLCEQEVKMINTLNNGISPPFLLCPGRSCCLFFRVFFFFLYFFKMHVANISYFFLIIGRSVSVIAVPVHSVRECVHVCVCEYHNGQRYAVSWSWNHWQLWTTCGHEDIQWGSSWKPITVKLSLQTQQFSFYSSIRNASWMRPVLWHFSGTYLLPFVLSITFCLPQILLCYPEWTRGSDLSSAVSLFLFSFHKKEQLLLSLDIFCILVLQKHAMSTKSHLVWGAECVC